MAGKARSPLVVILLSIVTLGIYALYWHYAVFEELKVRFGRGIGGVVGLILGLLLLPVVWFLLPHEIGNDVESSGGSPRVSALTGFWNLIPLLGTIIWIFKVQGAMNEIWISGEVSSTTSPA